MWAHYYVGDARRILAWSDRVLQETGSDTFLGKSIMGHSPRLGALHCRATAMMYLGQLAKSRRAFEEVDPLAEETSDLELMNWDAAICVQLAYAIGDHAQVLEMGRRCIAMGERLATEHGRCWGHFSLGTAYLIEGQYAPARDSLRAGVLITREHRTLLCWLPWQLAMLAETHLALGEYDDALTVAREGIQRGRDGGWFYFEACSQIALARILLASGEASQRVEIEAALDRAEQLVTQIEGRSLSPRILELRGRLAAALGDTAASGQTLQDALDLYREIGATGHAERLGREIRG
jgi:tetratricopeptide (TPR) repeat protein